MKLKIKNLEELRKLEKYFSEDKEGINFRLDKGSYSLHKDFISKELEIKIHWGNESDLCMQDIKSGRMFPIDIFEEHFESLSEKADQLKNAPAGEVFSIPKGNMIFKSKLEFFQIEKDGLKNNTVRKVDWNDDRFTELLEFSKGYGEINLEIRCVEFPKMCFYRKVKNVCFWEDLVIITWYI